MHPGNADYHHENVANPPFVDLFQDMTPGHETRTLGHIERIALKSLFAEARYRSYTCYIELDMTLLWESWTRQVSLRRRLFILGDRSGTFDEVYIYIINTTGNGGGQVMINDAPCASQRGFCSHRTWWRDN